MKIAGHHFQSALADLPETINCGRPIRDGAPLFEGKYRLTSIEGDRFLRIASQAARITRHFELFQLLQGEVQHFMPHQIMVCAWGDFFEPSLNLDVISPIAGVRTSRLGGCNIESQFRRLHLRWLAHRRQPLLFDGTTAHIWGFPACGCSLHTSLHGMQSALLHGFHDARNGTDSLYLAARAGAMATGGDVERFRFLVDSLIAHIDTGFRRVSGLKPAGTPADREDGVLSDREKEILAWVSDGRTNREISSILAISEFTVKNHVQRIIKKLGTANRTEAAAKYRQLAVLMPGAMRPLARKSAARNGAAHAVK